MRLKKGTTRWVLLAFGYAVKFPSLYNWQNFLYGMIANINERKLSKCAEMQHKLCPVVFSSGIGLFVVMPEAKPLGKTDFTQSKMTAFCIGENYYIPAEIKPDSFGYLNGCLVAIDYG